MMFDDLIQQRRSEALQQGAPYVEIAPTSRQESQVDYSTADPGELLQQQYGAQLKQIEAEFGTQESALKSILDQQMNSHERRYNIERSAIENAQGVERDQMVRQIEQLNKKYSLKIEDAQSSLQPALQELEIKRRKIMADMDRRRMAVEMEHGVIDRLVRDGVISDPMVAQQQKLQAMGINIPITQMRQPRPLDIIQDAQQELKAVDNMLIEMFEPGHEGVSYLGIDVTKGTPTRVHQINPTTGEEELVPMTKRAWELQRDLVKRRRELLKTIGEQSTQMFRFQRAMATAQGLRTGNPMADKVSKLVEKEQPKPKQVLDEATAAQILQEAGGDKARARQIAKQRGYSLNG